ncbi:hypothetical protein [Quatrionicoccus australiensis]|uniref:hypothetical protein n=1 Tax=Quatrionicoccus australiensis TaxID=138118 RepID=UPI001CF935AD|nr:hypothetical protein [Quatrionicoccus australiensis]MCB4361489.1 hypothetical protein [Quatrionicoccus australiensis]
MDILDMCTDVGRTKATEHDHRKKEMVAKGQQLYATIKRSSDQAIKQVLQPECLG